MARRIRRKSMERLELYDLDHLYEIISPAHHRGPPPVPPPRQRRCRLSDPQANFERYQFLCDMKRHKTDPIYAATPMFSTIPQQTQRSSPRRLLGSYIRPEIITPLKKTTASESSDSEDGEASDKDEEEAEEEEEEKDDADDDDDTGSAADDDNDESSSSSSSDDADNDGYDDDDDDKRGIIEQIFNRNKK